jgi:hypothetical protein
MVTKIELPMRQAYMATDGQHEPSSQLNIPAVTAPQGGVMGLEMA